MKTNNNNKTETTLTDVTTKHIFNLFLLKPALYNQLVLPVKRTTVMVEKMRRFDHCYGGRGYDVLDTV